MVLRGRSGANVTGSYTEVAAMGRPAGRRTVILDEITVFDGDRPGFAICSAGCPSPVPRRA